ncbi:MAG: hypothetical protein WC761_05340 [Candidatus Paceibacterota bacterium]|jgi:hypothetical protein
MPTTFSSQTDNQASYPAEKVEKFKSFCSPPELFETIASQLPFSQFDIVWLRHLREFQGDKEAPITVTKFTLSDGKKIEIASESDATTIYEVQ